MKQFNLKEWLQNKSRKVVTRDGKEVALFGSTSGNEQYPVKGMIEKNPTICTWTETGIAYCNGNPQSDDLFFADDKLTEFEKELQIIISEASHWTSDDGSLSTYCQFGDKEIKKISAQVLDLARKEIREEQQEKLGTIEMPIDVTEPYYIKGKQDALKSLPKWKKATKTTEFDKHVAIMGNNRVVLDVEVRPEEYYIELSDLLKLPKEE